MSEIEIDIWNECTRLIALVILYYNTHLLSRLCEIKQFENDQEALDFLKHISSAATQHINIDGLYEFSEGLAEINLDNEVINLNRILNKTLHR